MKISQYAAFSQRGRGKSHNEDAVLLDGQVYQGSVREGRMVDTSQPRYFAIADGVAIGTLPRLASRRLLEILRDHLASASATESLSTLLHRVQQDYVALSENPKLYGMASTLVGVRLLGNAATIFNVGDSRAYLLADGRADLLSRDHSLLNDLMDDGEITAEQATNSASILQGLTCQFIVDAECDDFRANIATHELQRGERILLCSDGLNEALDDVQIAALFANESEADLVNVLKAARRAGGSDDFSVIVLAGDQ
ncbi:protein phosphatase 2C domain-containing protein [Nitrosomonas sp. Is35]|uniref:PP2C family protein-serine/threonine phosphatase n=1 Tax=Nitrosomonas sp. Is35 TaxID=3080534 RepID=UPI00294AB161|nr:protein phosphatase 2C domain-containing protein [Nitrosomonas sp. Is35]MDV6348158.1 protein phosphatase 2C domain-containing protein [Nitrosomonas sp. Is35]